MNKRSFIFLLLLSLSLIFFYLSSFSNFFFQDDFYNMNLAQNHNVIDAFNIFKKPIMNFYFYRPFSTQLYWTVGRALFNLSPLGYHVVNFSFFLTSIILVYKFASQIFRNEKIALLTSFFYAYSASHFYRLFFLSQFQEFLLAVFTFATLLLFLRRSAWTPVLFILALTTKETAVMIVPFMFFSIFLIKENEDKRVYFKLFFISLVILLVYLFARIFFFGFARGGVYAYDFNPLKIVNNFFWYGLWSLGIPEAFVNIEIFKLPTIINPKLFTVFESWGNITIASFVVFVILIFKPLVLLLKKFDRKILFSFAWFACFILPVAFFPFHKFPYSVTIPLFGSSILLAYSVARLGKKSLILICTAYLILSTSSYMFNLSNHWASRKAASAHAVFDYFIKNYPQKPDNTNIYFRNSKEPLCLLIKPGMPYFSREISYAISDDVGLRLLYKDEKLPIYFEDLDFDEHFSTQSLVLDSQFFFR